MDLFGPTSVSSISHKWYCLVVTDDFSRFTWTFFLKSKDETSDILKKFITKIEYLKDLKVKIIRCDNGGEFRNKEMNDFCSQKGIKREFSNARTPQQNGVAKRKNRTLIKAARTMLADAKLLVTFWAEAVNTACYVQNRWKLQSHCFYIKPPADHMETLIVESPIPTISSPVPTAYSTDSQEPSSNARLISKRVANQEETPSLDNILSLTNWFEDILGGTTNSDESYREEADISNMEIVIIASPTPTLRIHKDHPKSQIIGPVDTLIQTRNKSKEEEGIDYDEVFAPVARIEAIRLFLAYASFMGFTVYQMDVKSAFLYGTIDEEVKQIEDFILVQVYVDDIIFGSSNPQLCREFEALMHDKFQMSAMGELNFFLGLQVLQKEDVIFLLQDKYVGNILKKFGYSDVRHQVTPKECHLHEVKRIFSYLKGHPKLRLWYPKESPFDLVSFSDSDYGGATQDRKSTTGGLSMPCEALSREFSTSILRLLIPLFWSTAWIETTKEGTKILATVDGIIRTVSESSLRRNLKLQDEEGVSSLPDAELFENLTLMGYNISPNQKFTFQKGQFSHQWKYLIHTIMTVPLFDAMLVHQGEGSGTPTEPHHTPSYEAQTPSHTTHPSSSLPPVTTTSIPIVTPTETTPIWQYTRRTRIAQSSVPPTVADEPASPQRDVSQGEAYPTNSNFIADQDMETIDKSFTLPYDSAPRVTSPAAVEAQEVDINRLKERVKQLEEREGVATTNSGDDAPIKGRSMDEGEATTERVSDDIEEMATMLTSIDAATVLASGVVDVPTGSGSIPTASTLAEGSVPTGSEEVPTASLVFATATVVTPVTRRKGKEVLVESETPKK
nr:putative ribonuclease H-like domain-containing protein [Tanacetum cinerariifolium]